jgi:hypothetical protein
LPEGGANFSDGIRQHFLQFNSGIEAKVFIAQKKGCLVV